MDFHSLSEFCHELVYVYEFVMSLVKMLIFLFVSTFPFFFVLYTLKSFYVEGGRC